MASFFGHGLAALGIYGCTPAPVRRPGLWAGSLLLASWAADCDYLIAGLRVANPAPQQINAWLGAPDPLRITHSLAGALLCAAALTLLWWRIEPQRWWQRGGVLLLAALAHLLLDMAVGVTFEPLLWPLSAVGLRLHPGILPSAGALELANRLLYRNLALEALTLGPLVALVWRQRLPWMRGRPAQIVALLLSAGGMVLGSQLQR